MLTPDPGLPEGGNRITHVVAGAHDGGVFGLCALRDGTLVSGGGRDRRVVLWGSDYSKLQEVEVRSCPTRLGLLRPDAPLHTCPSRPHSCVCPALTRLPPPLSPARFLRTSAPCAPWPRAGGTRCMWGPPATPSCRAQSTRASRCSSR